MSKPRVNSLKVGLKCGTWCSLLYIWVMGYALLLDNLDGNGWPPIWQWAFALVWLLIIFVGAVAGARHVVRNPMRPFQVKHSVLFTLMPFGMLYVPMGLSKGLLERNWMPLGLLPLWLSPILLVLLILAILDARSKKASPP